MPSKGDSQSVELLLLLYVQPKLLLRYLSEWRQIATSGPSEPWRNGDDFADYVADKAEEAARMAALERRRQETPLTRKRAMVVTPPSSSSSSVPCLD